MVDRVRQFKLFAADGTPAGELYCVSLIVALEFAEDGYLVIDVSNNVAYLGV